MVRLFVMSVVLAAVAFFSVKLLIGDGGLTHRTARASIGGAQPGGARRVPSLQRGEPAPVALRRQGGGDERIDISQLSDLDNAILGASSRDKAIELVFARNSVRKAVSSWVLKQSRACPGFAATVPSRVRVNMKLRLGQGRAEVYAFDSLQVVEGAPLDSAGATCLESQFRKAMPYAFVSPGLEGADFDGSYSTQLHVNGSEDCSL
jgi:hypothetical protein